MGGGSAKDAGASHTCLDELLHYSKPLFILHLSYPPGNITPSGLTTIKGEIVCVYGSVCYLYHSNVKGSVVRTCYNNIESDVMVNTYFHAWPTSPNGASQDMTIC